MNQRVQSINEYVQFVKFLDIGFDLTQLFLIAFLSSLESSCINQPNMGQFLILSVDLVPFPLEAFSDLFNFVFAKTFSN